MLGQSRNLAGDQTHCLESSVGPEVLNDNRTENRRHRSVVETQVLAAISRETCRLARVRVRNSILWIYGWMRAKTGLRSTRRKFDCKLLPIAVIADIFDLEPRLFEKLLEGFEFPILPTRVVEKFVEDDDGSRTKLLLE